MLVMRDMLAREHEQDGTGRKEGATYMMMGG